ncbi:MAG: DMT family transporter [Deltaproteobacteria bacterium]|jgi:drug/metabolite transporter (DMT)-like permease|nr:DMT family transporter [Deltaproteobacteria bacterium]
MKNWQADLMIMLAASIWGFSYISSRWGLSSCSPALFLVLRFGVAAVAVYPLLRKSLAKADNKLRLEGFILGLLMGGGYILQTYSINFTTVGRASFLTGMCLLGIPILGYVLFRQIVKTHSLIAVVIAIIGLYIFLNPSFSGINVGDVVGLISIPVWALYMIYMSVFTEGKTDPKVTYVYLFWQLVGVVPLALVTYIVFESGLVLPALSPDLGKGLTVTPLFLAGLLLNSLLASLLTVFLQTVAQRFTTAVQAMLCFQMEPLVAIVAGWLVLGEPIDSHTLVGGIIILFAVIFSELGGLWIGPRKTEA